VTRSFAPVMPHFDLVILRFARSWASPTPAKQEELAAWLHDLGLALNYGRCRFQLKRRLSTDGFPSESTI
jgi:hypothetical protein